MFSFSRKEEWEYSACWRGYVFKCSERGVLDLKSKACTNWWALHLLIYCRIYKLCLKLWKNCHEVLLAWPDNGKVIDVLWTCCWCWPHHPNASFREHWKNWKRCVEDLGFPSLKWLVQLMIFGKSLNSTNYTIIWYWKNIMHVL